MVDLTALFLFIWRFFWCLKNERRTRCVCADTVDAVYFLKINWEMYISRAKVHLFKNNRMVLKWLSKNWYASLLLRPITTGAITCNLLKAREKSRLLFQGAMVLPLIGWDNWHEIFKPVTRHSNYNRAITFDSHLKRSCLTSCFRTVYTHITESDLISTVASSTASSATAETAGLRTVTFHVIVPYTWFIAVSTAHPSRTMFALVITH